MNNHKQKLIIELKNIDKILGKNFYLDIDNGYWTGKFYHDTSSIVIYDCEAKEEDAINFLRSNGIEISGYLIGTNLHDKFFDAIDEIDNLVELALIKENEARAIMKIRNMLEDVIWHLEN